MGIGEALGFWPTPQQQPTTNQMNNPQQPPMGSTFFGQLQQFAGAINGNPEQIVRGLIQNGRMSQEQFNQLSSQATRIQQMLGIR